MDEVDRVILAQLQMDARLTITELASRAQLSVSPTHRRIRELERSGVINGYRAELNATAVGLGFDALVFVTMNDGSHDALSAFESALDAIPNIISAQRLFGDPDYLLRIVARDLPAFQELYDNALTSLPAVQRLSSTLVMKTVFAEKPLPL